MGKRRCLLRFCVGQNGKVRSLILRPQRPCTHGERTAERQIRWLRIPCASQGRLNKIVSSGQVAEWFKAAARKGCYATQVASEVRILPLSAKSEYSAEPLRSTPARTLGKLGRAE